MAERKGMFIGIQIGDLAKLSFRGCFARVLVLCGWKIEEITPE